MELKAYFSNLQPAVVEHLESAQTEILAAVNCFTDRDIFDVLCKKAALGLKVSVVLIGNGVNKGPGNQIFQKLKNFGGLVTSLPPRNHNEPIICHDFCVIDRTMVITGSHNWSERARSNDANITVVTNAAEFAAKYFDEFATLAERTGPTTGVVTDADAMRRRLEMIRNLILLGEQGDIAPHLHKLRPASTPLQLTEIITTLDSGEYKAALELIDLYLRRSTALVAASHEDIPHLRLQLETLELRLESLSDEKAEIERRLLAFNNRYDDALGDLVQRILKARAELTRRFAALKKGNKDQTAAKAAAEAAEREFQDYARQHEQLQHADPLPKLNENSERELKALYRKACSLCHPDKVTVDRKEQAHRVFIDLQDAFKRNDLNRVREIYETLKSGDVLGTRSSVLSKADALRAAIAELEHAIAKLAVELRTLQESDGVKLMDSAGSTEAEWHDFFVRQSKGLEKQLHKIEVEIMMAQMGSSTV